MTKLRTSILHLTLVSALIAVSALAQSLPDIDIRPLKDGEGRVTLDMRARTATGTNGIMVVYGNAVLTADTAELN